jgi:hypothetical protein
MSMSRLLAPAFALLALLVSACATGGSGADVTRFHLNQPLAPGTVFVEAAPGGQGESLEFRSYAASVGQQLGRLGYSVVPTLSQAELVAVVSYGQMTRESLGSGSPVRVGIGGGSFGGDVGVGLGTSIGLGSSKPRDVNVNMLSVQLKRRSDNSVVWEGRAVSEAREGSRYADLASAVPMLADALFDKFPGPSGQTTRYKPAA